MIYLLTVMATATLVLNIILTYHLLKERSISIHSVEREPEIVHFSLMPEPQAESTADTQLLETEIIPTDS